MENIKRNVDITVKGTSLTVTTPNAWLACGLSDQTITFSFSSEWSEYQMKTARFKYNGIYVDRHFNENVCSVPVLLDTRKVEIGVYAGEITSTEPVYVPCHESILDNEEMGIESEGVIISKGDDGFSPSISVVKDTDSEYVLSIETKDGEFETPMQMITVIAIFLSSDY